MLLGPIVPGDARSVPASKSIPGSWKHE